MITNVCRKECKEDIINISYFIFQDLNEIYDKIFDKYEINVFIEKERENNLKKNYFC